MPKASNVGVAVGNNDEGVTFAVSAGHDDGCIDVFDVGVAVGVPGLEWE